MTSPIYEWSVKYLASETIVLVLKPLIFFCQNGRSILCTILRIYCQEIKSVVNSISDQGNQNRSHIILRNYSQCAPSPLSVYFCLLRFLTISRKSADYSTLRFSFSIAQHIQNKESTCAVLRFLEALVSPHNLTSGHDYRQFRDKLYNNHNAPKKIFSMINLLLP